MGIINKWGLPNLMFKLFENNQYKIANNIGIQSEGDFDYFNAYKKHISKKVHVLNNWLSAPQTVDCDIRLSETKLQNRKIFIYSGNIGLAQNIPLFLKSVKELEYRTDIGFVIIGDGSEYDYVRSYISNNRLSNIRTNDGKLLNNRKKYVVSGWASVNSEESGKPIWEITKEYLSNIKYYDLSEVKQPKVVQENDNFGLET